MKCVMFKPNEWTDDNDAELRRGVAMLDKYNLTMDYWEHDYTLLPKFIRLAKAFPNVTMILDHLRKDYPRAWIKRLP